MVNLYHMEIDDIPPISMTDKCVVLDLDQTLVATQEHASSIRDLGILINPALLSLRNRSYYISIEDIEKPGIGTKCDFWGVLRPNIREFLIFCFAYFKIVAVWSAGQKPYVEEIVDYIFRDIRFPHIVFTRDDIVTGAKGHIEKPLLKMMNSNPILKRIMTPYNTLAIDDNNMTFSNNPGNGLLIPAYDPQLSLRSLSENDDALLKIKYWLLSPEVMNCKDVTTLDKSNIFSIPMGKLYKPTRQY